MSTLFPELDNLIDTVLVQEDQPHQPEHQWKKEWIPGLSSELPPVSSEPLLLAHSDFTISKTSFACGTDLLSTSFMNIPFNCVFLNYIHDLQ